MARLKKRKDGRYCKKEKASFWGGCRCIKCSLTPTFCGVGYFPTLLPRFVKKTVHWTNLSIHLKAWRHINFIFLFFFRTC